MGKLYGIGVGPGDPELVTLKAKRILNEVDVLFCPEKKTGAGSFAYDIVKGLIENQNIEIVYLVYPMHYNKDELYGDWARNGEIITDKLRDGKSGAFVTIGDSTIYSTFMYTLPYIDEGLVDVELVPGISSFSAIASRMKIPLMAWEENLLIAPVRKKFSEELEATVSHSDNIVLMKVSDDPGQIIQMLKKQNLEDKFVLVSKAGTDEECIIDDIAELSDIKLPYLSTLIIKKGGFK